MFPATQWSLLHEIRDCTAGTRNRLLDVLIRRYWHPVFVYLRGKGLDEDTAAEQTQAFFVDCLERGALLKADADRGRFRTFLLTCLSNFLRNAHRHGQAKRRRPPGGFVPLDELVSEYGPVAEPREEETPEDAFNRAWARDLLLRVLGLLEAECAGTGKEKHCELFRRRITEPVLEGADLPAMVDLAAELGLEEKQACNYLLTARRAYQRLLRGEVKGYAMSSGDVASEMRDVFRVFERK